MQKRMRSRNFFGYTSPRFKPLTVTDFWPWWVAGYSEVAPCPFYMRKGNKYRALSSIPRFPLTYYDLTDTLWVLAKNVHVIVQNSYTEHYAVISATFRDLNLDRNINLIGWKNSETKGIWTTSETDDTALHPTSFELLQCICFVSNCLDIAAATPWACQRKLRWWNQTI